MSLYGREACKFQVEQGQRIRVNGSSPRKPIELMGDLHRKPIFTYRKLPMVRSFKLVFFIVDFFLYLKNIGRDVSQLKILKEDMIHTATVPLSIMVINIQEGQLISQETCR